MPTIRSDLQPAFRSAPKLFWPDVAALPGLLESQREEARKALAGPIGILGGTPGTGKTYVAAAIVRGILAGGIGAWSIAMAAPTGKAAQRFMATMRGYQIEAEATTIHRLLGVNRSGHDGKGWGFNHNEANPLPQRFFLIDEASMLDVDLFAAFLKAVEHGSHVLLIGDIGQLPPVGHGAPLRDLIAAGVPYGELHEIKRNSGDIVAACREIRAARPWRASETINIAQGNNLLHCESPRAAVSLTKLQRMLGNLPAGVDPIWDCQVLCSVNAKSELGRGKLNKALQEQLNPSGEQVGKNPFRFGDKVICTSNTLLDLVPEVDEFGFPVPTEAEPDGREYRDDPENPNGMREFVANGEIGRVVHVEENLFHVRFDAPRRTVKVPLSGKKSEARGDEEHAGAACDFDLGYAITVHKSQGSQWRIVFFLIDDYPGARRVCSRELVYTALSRAEQLCVTIGKRTVVDQDCRKVALRGRKTFLRELINESRTA